MNQVFTFYQNRYFIYHEIVNEHLGRLADNLANGRISIGSKGGIYNQINDELRINGFGIEDVESVLLIFKQLR